MIKQDKKNKENRGHYCRWKTCLQITYWILLHKSQEIMWLSCNNPQAISHHVAIYKSFIRSHLEYYCVAWNYRIYHNSNLKLLESSQREALSLILRSFKLDLTVALEAELDILPVHIRLQELKRMECLKVLRENDNALKNKL